MRSFSPVIVALLWGACATALADDPPVKDRAGPAVPTASRKKLIEFGWDEPDTSFLRSRIAQLDRTPFDGTVFHVVVTGPAGSSENLTWIGWGKRRFTAEQVRRAIDDLAAVRPTRLKHNFLRFNLTPADLDWFDDHAAALANAKLAAQVARTGPCDGILLDTEEYQGKLFDYKRQRSVPDRGWPQYEAQVNKRGREIMAAFQEGYPNLAVLVTFGHSYVWKKSDAGKKPLADTEYGLLVPFLDGMIAAARPGTRIVDGHEPSYGFREAEQFQTARRVITRDAAALSRDRDAYRRTIAPGFGLWLDYNWPRHGWNTALPEKNYFSPEGFERSLRAALENSSEYAWIYTEKCRWWSDRGGSVDLPGVYVDAVKRARRELIGN